MVDGKDALVQAHRNNIGRYQKLLKTHLTRVERRYIEGRLAEEQAALQTAAGSPSVPTARTGLDALFSRSD
jgi:hypothetical protein